MDTPKALFGIPKNTSPILLPESVRLEGFNERKAYQIWTDGSCLATRNIDGKKVPDKCGGWGWYRRRKNPVLRTKRGWGYEIDTTISRMELMAAIQSLIPLKSKSSVILTTDSEYVQLGVTQRLEKWGRHGYRKEHRFIPNHDLWIALTEQLNRLHVKVLWVKGHSGIKGNQIADRLAGKGRKRALLLKGTL